VLAKSPGSTERSLIATDKNTRYCKKRLIKSRQSAGGRVPAAIGIEQARKRPHSLIFQAPSLGCLHIFSGDLVNNIFTNFGVLLTVHLSIFISVINQLDAQNFCFKISLFHASTGFEHMCSSSGGQNCITQPLVSSHLSCIKLVNY